MAESESLCLSELSLSISGTGAGRSVSQALVKSGGRSASASIPSEYPVRPQAMLAGSALSEPLRADSASPRDLVLATGSLGKAPQAANSRRK